MTNPHHAEKEFADQIKKYLKHFKMLTSDLGAQIGTEATDIRRIIEYEKSVGIKRAERIAGVFGLRYYEFANPDHPLPLLKELPQKTQKVIEERKIKGYKVNSRKANLNLPRYLKALIERGELDQPTTSRQLLEKLPPVIQEQIKFQPRRISDVLGKTEGIEKVGKIGKERLYQLKTKK